MNWGLPTSVEIGGESYEIRTDFRVILDIFVMLSDPDLSGTDRAEASCRCSMSRLRISRRSICRKL